VCISGFRGVVLDKNHVCLIHVHKGKQTVIQCCITAWINKNTLFRGKEGLSIPPHCIVGGMRRWRLLLVA
jgi:hypothetical protein